MNPNTSYRLPGGLLGYYLACAAIVLVIFAVPSFYYDLYLGLVVGSGVALISVLMLAYGALWYKFFSFSFDNVQITLNEGVLIKTSESIAFANVQNVQAVKGPLMSLFGIAKLNIWTASPSQVVIADGRTNNKPDGVLFLNAQNAVWLQNFILQKRPIQVVQVQA